MLFFRRLRINHDSHEFVLESGTIANSQFLWSRIRPEGLSWARSSMVKLEEEDWMQGRYASKSSMGLTSQSGGYSMEWQVGEVLPSRGVKDE